MIYILVACIMCSQNRHLVTLTLVLDAAFVFLFLDFYRKAYRGKKGTKEMGMVLLHANDVQYYVYFIFWKICVTFSVFLLQK